MKHKTLSNKELGIIILSRFYLFLIVLHILPLCVFSTSVYLFGHKQGSLSTLLTAIAFILFLYFLYDAIRHIKLIGFFLALIFQLFFAINNIQMLFDRIQFLSIRGERIVFLTVEKSAVAISIFVNILVSSLLVYYLFILSGKLYKRRIRRLKKNKKAAYAR